MCIRDRLCFLLEIVLWCYVVISWTWPKFLTDWLYNRDERLGLSEYFLKFSSVYWFFLVLVPRHVLSIFSVLCFTGNASPGVSFLSVYINFYCQQYAVEVYGLMSNNELSLKICLNFIGDLAFGVLWLV